MRSDTAYCLLALGRSAQPSSLHDTTTLLCEGPLGVMSFLDGIARNSSRLRQWSYILDRAVRIDEWHVIIPRARFYDGLMQNNGEHDVVDPGQRLKCEKSLA